jgi:uncharacterized protein YciI
MKSVLAIFLFAVIAVNSQGQGFNPNYDSLLAKKLGANEYGMKTFTLVLLKTGTKTSAAKSFVDSCFKGHMANIQKMEKKGQLIVAGPMGKNDKTYRGIFILNVSNLEEAKKLVDDDPAIMANILAAEFYIWHGSAALPMYLETADKIWKSGF